MCDDRFTTPPGYTILRDYPGRWYWLNSRNDWSPRLASREAAVLGAWRHYAECQHETADSARVAEKTDRHARSAGSGREALDRLRAGPQYPVLPVGYRISRETTSAYVVQKRGRLFWERVAVAKTLDTAMRAAWQDSQESP